MTNVLYIGNNLKSKQSNITSIAILGPLLEAEGYRLFYASSKVHKIARLTDMVLTVIRYHKRVDVVLIDTYSTQNFYYALLISQLCKIFRLTYVPILRGGNLTYRLEQTPRLSQLIFKDAKTLVAPSLFMKSLFEAHAYTSIAYIPNSIPIQRYAFKKKAFKTIQLLWVRSFSTIYNPTLAVRVLHALCEAGYDATLCMVGPDTGDGSFQETQQLAANLEVAVTFTGKLSKQEWLALASDYNVFINTTNFDNMPVSVVEAMALGLPVVSTNVGGMPFLIKDGVDGLLVPPEDTASFVSAIKSLVDNPEASQAMAFNARQKAEQFDWEVVKQQWFGVLDIS